MSMSIDTPKTRSSSRNKNFPLPAKKRISFSQATGEGNEESMKYKKVRFKRFRE